MNRIPILLLTAALVAAPVAATAQATPSAPLSTAKKVITRAEDLPRRAPKALKPTRRGLAFVLSRKDGAILLRKRPPKGLLGGMDEVPSSPWREGKLSTDKAIGDAPVPARWQILDGLVRHTFTHFHLELTVARATATTGGLAKLAPGTSWCTVDRMTERALPTVMRKVIAHAVRN